MSDFKELVKNLYTSKNRELTPEKFDYIQKTYSNGKEQDFVKNFYATIGEDLTEEKLTYISDTYLKKKDTSASSATPSRLPKISEQVSPLQQGANIVGGGVIGDISKTVPKGSIKEAALADKKKNESYLGALWNNVVGSAARLAGGATRAAYQFSGNPVVRMERDLLDKAGQAIGKNLLAAKEKEYADVAKGFIERGRTSASSKEYEKKLAEGFDVTDGIGVSDLKGLGTMIPQFVADMGLAVGTGGSSFAIQGYDDALSMVDEMPEASNISEGTRVAFGIGGALVVGALEKLGLDNLIKNPAAKKYVTAKIIKEATDELVKKGAKVTAEQFERTVKEKAAKLTAKELTKIAAKRGIKSAAIEGGTEAVQEGGMDLLKLAANKIESKEIFDEEEMKDTAAKRYLNSLAAGGVLGGIAGAGVSRFQNTQNAIKDRLKNVKTVEDVDAIVAEINDNVADGTMTQEEADDVLPIVQNFVEVSQKVPAELIGKNKVEAVDLISEREKISEQLKQIEEQKAALDPAFHKNLDEDAKQLEERANEINNELAELAKPENNVEEEIQQPVEDKKADIEKRRKQELKERVVYDVFPTVQDGEFKIIGDPNNRVYRINENTGRPQELDPSNGLWSNTALAPNLFMESAKRSGFEKLKENINAKYDAELKALEEKNQQQQIPDENIQQPIEEQLPNQVEEDVVENANKLNKEAGIDLFVARKPIEIKGEKFVLSQIKENNNDNSFIVENEKGEEIGKAQLSADGNFLENIRIDEKYRRKGLATQIYNFIEDRKGINLQPSPVKQSKEAKALWDKRRKIEDLHPEIVESVRVEQEPELPEGTKVVTLSGMQEGERVKAVEERKKKTTLTEKETLHNDLIDLANRVQKSRGNEKTNLQGQIRQRVRELNAKLGEEIYKYDGVSVRAKVKSKTKGERYLKIKGTTRDTSGRAIKEDAVLLFDRSPEFVQKYEELADSPNITALQVDSGNGVTMTAEQIESALQDIADGIPSVQADNLLNALEEGFNRGYFDLRGKDIGQDRVQASVEDFIGVQQEEVGQPMDEEALMEYLDDESQFSPEEDEQIFEDFKNLINEYESQPQKTVIEREVPKAKPTAEVGSPKPTQSNEKGKADGEPKADLSKEPIGEAKADKSPLEQEYEEANNKKGEKAKQKAKEKLISDNFDGIVAQLMTKNKIKRQC